MAGSIQKNLGEIFKMSNYVVNVPVSLTIPVRTEGNNEKEARDNALYAIEKFFKQLKYNIKPNKITIEENPEVMFKTSGEIYASSFRSDIFEGWQGMEPKQKPEPVRQDRSDILAEELNILQYHVMSRKYG